MARWQLTTLSPAISPIFWALIRTPHAERDMPAVAKHAVKLRQVWTLLDAELAHRPYVAGSTLSIADLAMGNSARRWYAFDLDGRICRIWRRGSGGWRAAGFRTHVMTPVV